MRAIHLPDVRLEGGPLPQIPSEINFPERAASRMSMTYAKVWQAFLDDLLRCDICGHDVSQIGRSAQYTIIVD
jgi:hypothetical protein